MHGMRTLVEVFEIECVVVHLVDRIRGEVAFANLKLQNKGEQLTGRRQYVCQVAGRCIRSKCFRMLDMAEELHSRLQFVTTMHSGVPSTQHSTNPIAAACRESYRTVTQKARDRVTKECACMIIGEKAFNLIARLGTNYQESL